MCLSPLHKNLTLVARIALPEKRWLSSVAYDNIAKKFSDPFAPASMHHTLLLAIQPRHGHVEEISNVFAGSQPDVLSNPDFSLPTPPPMNEVAYVVRAEDDHARDYHTQDLLT